MCYTVWVGRETGIFESWGEVELLVKGFKGAKFKRFDNYGDAEKAFLEGAENAANFDVLKKIKAESLAESEFNESSLYCEGNYNNETNILNIKVVDLECGDIAQETNIVLNYCEYNVAQFLAIVSACSFISSRETGHKHVYNNSTASIYWAREIKVGGNYKNSASTRREVELALAMLNVYQETGDLPVVKKVPACLKKEVAVG